MLICPICGENTKVVDSRVVDGKVVRRRKCVKNHISYTIETYVDTMIGMEEINNYWKKKNGVRDEN